MPRREGGGHCGSEGIVLRRDCDCADGYTTVNTCPSSGAVTLCFKR